jgi:2-polyprenyl-3-methyl-5-hydroxy-6-metoxy-1,4-benzoquinol methylase
MINIHAIDVLSSERSKYEDIWSVEQYKDYSPGEENVARFLSVIKPNRGESLVDLGCGAGIAGKELKENGLDVYWVDLTDSALDNEIDRKRFTKCSIWERNWTRKRTMGWDYGFCCDVLEHIPTEFTMLTLDRITSSCRTTWLQIAFEPDSFGPLIGQPLHLTVQSFTWWRDRIAKFGKLVEARDLCGCGLFVVKQ